MTNRNISFWITTLHYDNMIIPYHIAPFFPLVWLSTTIIYYSHSCATLPPEAREVWEQFGQSNQLINKKLSMTYRATSQWWKMKVFSHIKCHKADCPTLANSFQFETIPVLNGQVICKKKEQITLYISCDRSLKYFNFWELNFLSKIKTCCRSYQYKYSV